MYKRVTKDSVLSEPQNDYLSALLEKTFNIKKDVEYIYNSAFRIFIDVFNTRDKKLIFSKYPNITKSRFQLNMINSEDLVSRDCQKAHKLNPIFIYCGCYDNGSFYSFNAQDGSPEKIQISMHQQAMHYLLNVNYDISALTKSEQRSIVEELSESRIKSTIYHEVSHWLSNTLYNKHLDTLFQLSKDLKKPEMVLLQQKDIDMTYFEIDAQIHAIKNLKQLYKKQWDTMTLTDIAFKYTPLRNIVNSLNKKYGKDVLDIWQKLLIKRMVREKLLGKNMIKFFNVKELSENYYNDRI